LFILATFRQITKCVLVRGRSQHHSCLGNMWLRRLRESSDCFSMKTTRLSMTRLSMTWLSTAILATTRLSTAKLSTIRLSIKRLLTTRLSTCRLSTPRLSTARLSTVRLSTTLRLFKTPCITHNFRASGSKLF